MKILYLNFDVGIDVDNEFGGAAHIKETISGFRALGHDVLLISSAGGAKGNNSFNPKDLIRVPKHELFHLIKTLFRFVKRKKTEPPNPGGLLSTSPMKKEPEKTDDFETGKSKSIQTILMDFFYGSFQYRIHRIEEASLYKYRFKKVVKRAMKSFCPDAVYERYALGHRDCFLLCRKQGIPFILEVNALLARETRTLSEKQKNASAAGMRKEIAFLKRVKNLMVVSEQLKKEIAPDSQSIVVNPNGVNPGLFHPKIQGFRILKQYGLERKKVLGWVGGFGPGRGLEQVVDIATQINQIQKDIVFLIVGDGPLKDKVVELIKSRQLSHMFVLTGSVSKTRVPQYIAAMDIALAPYPAQGAAYFSPLKVFEYMAMAKVVAAIDEGQCRELLGDGAGLLLPPDDHRLWAEKIVKLLDDDEKRKQMGDLARKKILDNYSWEINTRRIVDRFAAMMN